MNRDQWKWVVDNWDLVIRMATEAPFMIDLPTPQRLTENRDVIEAFANGAIVLNNGRARIRFTFDAPRKDYTIVPEWTPPAISPGWVATDWLYP